MNGIHQIYLKLADDIPINGQENPKCPDTHRRRTPSQMRATNFKSKHRPKTVIFGLKICIDGWGRPLLIQ